MRLAVTSDVEHGVGVVVASGEVDLATAPSLRQAISDHLAAGQTLLLLDMTDVTFIDSTGLGILVGAAKKARGLGGSMRLVCDNPRILRLLTITGLARALPVHPTRAEAVLDWRDEAVG
ncbi:MAG: STAS domain-containing protein [Nocardioidaceae bacterium]|nr:STAS domain-containing protein [Nocardioidaceae bacterium]NUS51490.1 STAS domain-containing protein [Nocardioidaceae bacterium]